MFASTEGSGHEKMSMFGWTIPIHFGYFYFEKIVKIDKNGWMDSMPNQFFSTLVCHVAFSL